ncbi:unnamed protein product [Camellia sinensis]
MRKSSGKTIQRGSCIKLFKMSQQNKNATSSTQADHPPGKRKRGRPRKDEKAHPPLPPPSVDLKAVQHVEVDLGDDIDDDMVGQVVSGVIEGSFDAGYFLTVRAANDTNKLLRGVVFQPGLFTPITASNDVAPQAKMHTRREFPIPVLNPQGPVNGSLSQSEQKNEQSSAQISLPDQSASVTVVPVTDNLIKNDYDSSVCLGGKYMPQENFESGVENFTVLGGENLPQLKGEFGLEKQSTPHFEHGKIVEHERMMQEFEASTMSNGPKLDVKGSENMMLEIASKITADTFPGNEEAVTRVQAQAVDSALEASELAHQTLLAAELRLVTSEPISKPVNTTENPLSMKTDMPQTIQSELAENPARDDETNESAFGDVADKTKGVFTYGRSGAM